MSISLNELKDKINSSVAFGPLPREDQRIFHLGRELKTGGRSLSVLGVGRFKCFTLHLLAKGGSNNVNNSNKNGTVNDAADEESVEVIGKRKARAARRSGRQAVSAAAPKPASSRPIIELGDSDDDVDDDDDDVVVIAAPSKRPRSRR